MGKIVTFLCTITLLLVVCGCAVTDGGGTTRHFILGFGWVKVNNAHTNLAVIQKVNAVGIYGGTSPYAKVGLGYMNLQTIEVVTNSNLIMEVNKARVTIPCVQH